MKIARTVMLLAVALASGCSFTADDRRTIAEDAARLAILRAAPIVRTEMESDGFSQADAARFTDWLIKRAEKIAERYIEKIRRAF